MTSKEMVSQEATAPLIREQAKRLVTDAQDRLTQCQRFHPFDAPCAQCAFLEQVIAEALLSAQEVPAPTETAQHMDKRTAGLYAKFHVRRTDGSDGPGGKHEGCSYFVLDLSHDKHALPAIRAYADSCREEFPALARDLDAMVPRLDIPSPDPSPREAFEAGFAIGHRLPIEEWTDYTRQTVDDAYATYLRTRGRA